MKLIFCPECGDIRMLHRSGVTCWCGKSSGRYMEDNLHAEISGLAIPIGIDNRRFVAALAELRLGRNSMGPDINAFLIAESSSRIRRLP